MTTSDDAHPFDAIIRLGVTAVLKSAGFRKSARSFHRRRGSCVQVVNIQLSQSSTADEKRFYINVGVAFDAICALRNIPVLAKPKEHECDARGTRDRLGRLLPGLAADWDVGTDTDVPSAADRLARDMSTLVAELDQIDGPATYRQHR